MPQVSEIFFVVLYLSKLPEFSIAFYSHQCWNFSQHIGAVYICLHQLCNVSRFFHILLKLNPSSPIYQCQFSTLLCNLNSKNLTLLTQSLHLFFGYSISHHLSVGLFIDFERRNQRGAITHASSRVNEGQPQHWSFFWIFTPEITIDFYFCLKRL